MTDVLLPTVLSPRWVATAGGALARLSRGRARGCWREGQRGTSFSPAPCQPPDLKLRVQKKREGRDQFRASQAQAAAQPTVNTDGHAGPGARPFPGGLSSWEPERLEKQGSGGGPNPGGWAPFDLGQVCQVGGQGRARPGPPPPRPQAPAPPAHRFLPFHRSHPEAWCLRPWHSAWPPSLAGSCSGWSPGQRT